MKILTLEGLLNEINADIAWRKKEIAEFDTLRLSNKNTGCLERACFVMLCAHFEGSIRFASNAYIAFISGQKIKGSDLKLEINAIAVRKKKHQLFSHTGAKKVKISSVLEVLKLYNEIANGFFYIKMSEDDLLPEIDEKDPALPTEGNPTPDVLREIAEILGLDYDSMFKMKESFINSELLNVRHSIAHGERRPIKHSEFEDAKRFVLRIMDDFSSAIIEAATENAHMKISSKNN